MREKLDSGFHRRWSWRWPRNDKVFWLSFSANQVRGRSRYFNLACVTILVLVTNFNTSPAHAKWTRIRNAITNTIKAPVTVPLQVTREAGKVVGGDIGKAVEHVSAQALKEVDRAEEKVGDFAKKHERELMLVAIVAASAGVACADGCTLLVGIGDAVIPVGSIGAAGTAGAGTGGALVLADKLGKPSDTASPPAGSNPKPVDAIESPSRQVLVQPNSLRWRRHGFLTMPSNTRSNEFIDYAGDVADAIKDAISSGELPKPGMAAVQITFSPATADAPEYTEDREVSARLGALLEETSYHTILRYWGSHNPRDIPAPNPPGPVLRTNDVVLLKAESVSVDEAIKTKAEMLGAVTGLPAGEVIKRIQQGVRDDTAERQKQLFEAPSQRR